MGSVVVARDGRPPDTGDGPEPRSAGRPLPRREPSLELLALPVHTELVSDGSVAEALARIDTDAFLVLHDGALVCEHYRTPAAEHTAHPLRSVTKSLVGCLAGMLMAEGLLDPDAAASAYVPDLAGGGYRGATVRDLLDMRTGGEYREAYDDPTGELVALGRICGWWDHPESTDPTLAGPEQAGRSVRAWLSTIERTATTGGPFTYRSADTEVLGWVIETVAGRSLAELVGQRLLAPIGAESDGWFDVDPTGCALASGGLALVPRDVARFGALLVDGGAVGDEQVLPDGFLRDTCAGQADSVAAFHHRVGATLGPDAPFPPKGLYRNQFWVLEAGRPRLLCLGVHGQLVLVDGDAGVVVVLLSTWPTPQDPLRFDTGLSVALAMVEALAEPPRRGLSVHR